MQMGSYGLNMRHYFPSLHIGLLNKVGPKYLRIHQQDQMNQLKLPLDGSLYVFKKTPPLVNLSFASIYLLLMLSPSLLIVAVKYYWWNYVDKFNGKKYVL